MTLEPEDGIPSEVYVKTTNPRAKRPYPGEKRIDEYISKIRIKGICPDQRNGGDIILLTEDESKILADKCFLTETDAREVVLQELKRKADTAKSHLIYAQREYDDRLKAVKKLESILSNSAQITIQ